MAIDESQVPDEWVEPDPESAAAAVAALQAELELADGNLDALDRKAALLPAFLAAIAGLFIDPDSTVSGWGLALVVAALVLGVLSVAFALLALRARPLVVGPTAANVAKGVDLPIQYFNQAIAGSLALAIDKLTEVAFYKARWFNRSLLLALATILVLSLSRIAGPPNDDETTHNTPAPATPSAEAT